jgi:hypothetical protein
VSLGFGGHYCVMRRTCHATGDECFEHAMLFARTHVTQLTYRTSIDGAVASSWSPLTRYLSHDAEALHGLGLA